VLPGPIPAWTGSYDIRRGLYSIRFPKVSLFTIDKVFGGWQKVHFAA
jgi:ABC-type sulfate transport system substrate-binding protein